jgi:tetraacyldisaccharide 4'-kinase
VDAPRPLSPPPAALDRALGGLFLLAWRLVGLLALPLVLLHPRARRHAWRVPAPEPGRTWVHGASAGEHRVVAALRRAHGPGVWPTSGSVRTPVPTAAPAPWDLPFVVGRWLDRARPARLVLVEAALWPGWLAACRARGIPVTVVHAREGRGTARWRRLGPLWRWLGEGVGVLGQEETGDLKAEAPAAAGPALSGAYLVGASTREGDEARLLAAWSTLPAPRPRLVVAPRHAARFDAAHALLCQGRRVARRSTGEALDTDVVLLDSTGELAHVLQGAAAAFIGGTFDRAIGGHSPTEATAAGVPVCAGPHTAANPAAWAEARSVRALADTPEALGTALRGVLELGRVPPPATRGRAAAVLAALPPPAPPPETAARPWLWPAVPVVHALGRRRAGFAGSPVRAPIPVVSVGGLTAGGSGKTPVAAWLAARLPGAWVVGRGYRRPGGGADVRIGRPGVQPMRPLGDELEMLRRRGIPVVSCPDRVRGAAAAAEAGARLIVLDDGFQHRRLHRDLDIVCIDARWPTGRGPIPVGTGREGWAALARADVVWVHHAPVLDRPWPVPGPGGGLPQVRSRAAPSGWRVAGEDRPLGSEAGPAPVACGLARPGAFLGQLADLGLPLDDLDLRADHAALGPVRPGTRMTEKDAARLPEGAPVAALLQALEVADAQAALAPARALLGGAP